MCVCLYVRIESYRELPSLVTNGPGKHFHGLKYHFLLLHERCNYKKCFCYKQILSCFVMWKQICAYCQMLPMYVPYLLTIVSNVSMLSASKGVSLLKVFRDEFGVKNLNIWKRDKGIIPVWNLIWFRTKPPQTCETNKDHKYIQSAFSTI